MRLGGPDRVQFGVERSIMKRTIDLYLAFVDEHGGLSPVVELILGERIDPGEAIAVPDGPTVELDERAVADLVAELRRECPEAFPDATMRDEERKAKNENLEDLRSVLFESDKREETLLGLVRDLAEGAARSDPRILNLVEERDEQQHAARNLAQQVSDLHDRAGDARRAADGWRDSHQLSERERIAWMKKANRLDRALDLAADSFARERSRGAFFLQWIKNELGDEKRDEAKAFVDKHAEPASGAVANYRHGFEERADESQNEHGPAVAHHGRGA